MARMLYRNIGMNRDERIQNTFTRYLTCALDRENARFRYKQRQEQKMQPYDETGDEPASGELLAALADRQVTQRQTRAPGKTSCSRWMPAGCTKRCTPLPGRKRTFYIGVLFLI